MEVLRSSSGCHIREVDLHPRCLLTRGVTDVHCGGKRIMRDIAITVHSPTCGGWRPSNPSTLACPHAPCL